MKYLVYLRGKDGEDAGYWLGGLRKNGRPQMGTVTDNAILFDSAIQAYETAGKYTSLQKWRVGRRVMGPA